jgi:Uma2 family endonuclease
MSRRNKTGRTAASRVTLERAPAQERFAWPEELANLLGKIADLQLARKAGVDRNTVADERRRRGVAPFHPHRHRVVWTPEMIAQLGTASDADVASALGLHRSSVKRKRQLLGISPFSPPPHDLSRGFPWAPEDLALLGKMPDHQVATTIGTSPTSVCRKRLQLKIPPFAPSPPVIAWTEEMIEPMGRVPDIQVAQRYGISAMTVKRKRSQLGIPGVVDCGMVVPTPELRDLLRLPTSEVRHRTGLCWATIRNLRQELGIPDPYATRWSPEVIGRLGRKPDAQIAREIGLSPSRVRIKRHSLGIPPHGHPGTWKPEEIALLGTACDREISERLERSLKSVKAKRQKLRIPYIPDKAVIPPPASAKPSRPERVRKPKDGKREIEYPTSDGQPMAETTLHRKVMNDLIHGLEGRYADVPDVWVGGNLFLCYERGNPAAIVAPDVLLAKGVAKWDRPNYLLWEETIPSLVVEVTSRKTRREDQGKKKLLYEQLGIEELVLFDPYGEYLRPRLQGYRLARERYQPIPLEDDGSLLSRTTSLRFEPEGERLRLVDAVTGESLLWPEEEPAARRKEAAARRKEAAARQAAEARAAEEIVARQAAEARAAEAEERSRALEQELERLRKA